MQGQESCAIIAPAKAKKLAIVPQYLHRKSDPPKEVGTLRGVAFAVAGSLFFAVSVEPFADVVGGYICCS